MSIIVHINNPPMPPGLLTGSVGMVPFSISSLSLAPSPSLSTLFGFAPKVYSCILVNPSSSKSKFASDASFVFSPFLVSHSSGIPSLSASRSLLDILSFTCSALEHRLKMHSSPVPQSWDETQLFPMLHLAGHVPPQSISASSPLRIPSLHVLTSWHTPSKQALEAQSEFALHLMPLRHFPQLPPQSVSVSLPFFIPSSHDISIFAHFPLEQNPLAHSLLLVQELPIVQLP